VRILGPILVLAALSLAGCRFFSTDLARIEADPLRYHGRDVTLEGRVASVRGIPAAGVIGYALVAGSDSLLVLTPGAPPREGETVRIHGRVHRKFPVGERERVVLLVLDAPRGGDDVR
jgi:hypothetical protein